MLATVEADLLATPRIAFNRITFDFNFVLFVVCPERTVTSTDWAETFVCWLTEWWKGDANGFAMACYHTVFLWGCHYGFVIVVKLISTGWYVDVFWLPRRDTNGFDPITELIRAVLKWLFMWGWRHEDILQMESVKQSICTMIYRHQWHFDYACVWNAN
jgi:hypothetical protein